MSWFFQKYIFSTAGDRHRGWYTLYIYNIGVRKRYTLHVHTAGGGKLYTLKVHRRLLMVLFLPYETYVNDGMPGIKSASAFLPVFNCLSPASTFRHQIQSSTAGHGFSPALASYDIQSPSHVIYNSTVFVFIFGYYICKKQFSSTRRHYIISNAESET